ncbi:MAG: hypothetical protein KGO52_11240 [Nitrospirota bacterium]|nr:hypothetical protein [Nitrospirota bacterium]
MAGKKTKMIPALHVDEDLHGAIKQAADRGGRRMIDHVRYVLEMWHGLRQPENLPQHLGRLVESAQPQGQKKSPRALDKTG